MTPTISVVVIAALVVVSAMAIFVLVNLNNIVGA